MSKHEFTSGPWRQMMDGSRFVVGGKDGEIIPVAEALRADGDRPLPSEANAAFIVRACNSHAALLAALQATTEPLHNAICSLECTINETDEIGQLVLSEARKALEQARAAIAAATGGKP